MNEDLKRRKFVKFTLWTPWNQDLLTHKYVYLGVFNQLFENFIFWSHSPLLPTPSRSATPFPSPTLWLHCPLKTMGSSFAAPILTVGSPSTGTLSSHWGYSLQTKLTVSTSSCQLPVAPLLRVGLHVHLFFLSRKVVMIPASIGNAGGNPRCCISKTLGTSTFWLSCWSVSKYMVMDWVGNIPSQAYIFQWLISSCWCCLGRLCGVH